MEPEKVALMNSPAPSIYSVDTSSLMDWQARYYPTDVFTGLIDAVDRLAAEKRIFLAELVREEVEAVGTPELVQWCEDRKPLLVPTADLLAEALSIQSRFPGLMDPKAEHEEADAYVIALARLREGIVVSQETPASEKKNPKRSHFIPDVCRELGITCVSILGLMRREKLRF